MTTALKIKLRSTASLIPYERNPRKNDAAVAAVAKSIAEFGFRNPILLDQDSVVIAGHTRLKAAQQLQMKQVPCVVVDDLTPEQVRALRIADNSTAAIAEWDFDLLSTELADLPQYNFEDFGLELQEMKLALTEDGASAEEIPKNDEAEALLNHAWAEWRSDCAAAVRALDSLRQVSVGISRNAARIYFLNALYYKKTYPRFLALAYHPQMLGVAADSFSWMDLITGAANAKEERLRFALNDLPSWDRFIKGSLPLAGCRLPIDFPAALATDLIDEFCPAHGRVLDCCHGWGGRAVGFLLSRADAYVGFDTSPETAAGVRDLAADLLPYVSGKTIETRECCFEDVTDLDAASFDFALTSPPYFDVEKYTGAQTSFRRYRTFESWDTHFYRVMIERVAAALKQGAVFALQVGNQRYPLEEQAIIHASHCGLDYIETRASGIVNNFAETSPEDGEIIVVLKKR